MRAHQIAVEHFGGTWRDRLYLQFLGRSGSEVSEGIVHAARLSCSPADYRQQYLEAKSSLGNELRMHAFVSGLLRALTEREKLPIAFVSSGYDTAELDSLIKRVLVEAQVSPRGKVLVIGRDDERMSGGRKTVRGIGEIMHELGVTPHACLGLEDSLEGLRVLEGASMGTIIFVQHFANRELSLSDDWLLKRQRYVMAATASWREVRERLGN